MAKVMDAAISGFFISQLCLRVWVDDNLRSRINVLRDCRNRMDCQGQTCAPGVTTRVSFTSVIRGQVGRPPSCGQIAPPPASSAPFCSFSRPFLHPYIFICAKDPISLELIQISAQSHAKLMQYFLKIQILTCPTAIQNNQWSHKVPRRRGQYSW